ncbi:hypothetical protein CSB07_01910 [Candidatus Gracilibacteria bacterium]|nr:MAG: hypothetical protein CSB07_01910 [Candidatus Gracilibacteria bacterium]
MFKLLNRFAWVISLIAAFSFSLFVDRDGPFDDEGFISFIIVLLIFKFIILRKAYIEERVTFFVNAISNNKTIKSSLGTTRESLNILQKNEVDSLEKTNSYLSLQDDVNSLETSKKPLAQDNTSKENIYNTKKVESKASSIEIEEREFLQTDISEPSLSKPSLVEVFFEKTGELIKNFFSENILAKIGGILIFLCALFFLRLGFELVGNFGKIIIGMLVGFTVYGAGIFLDKKGLNDQAIVLLGIAILINFLVILSGRYLLGDVNSPYMSSGITFFFLILNTIFAVVTSFIYSSRTLLLFGFLCSFINPLFFIEDLQTYIIVGYSLIVSLGGLFLGFKKSDDILSIGIFVLANIIFLLVPFSGDIGWIVKLISSALVGVVTLFVIYKNNPKLLKFVFPINYIVIIFMLFGGGGDVVSMLSASISYMAVIILFFMIGIFYLLSFGTTLLYQIFIFPVLIVFGLIFIWGSNLISFIPFLLLSIVLAYIGAFLFIKNEISVFFKYFFFVVLGIFIVLTNGYLGISTAQIELSNIKFITVLIASFIFLLSSYSLSRKKDLEFLYAIGTLFSVFILFPILETGYSRLACVNGDISCVDSKIQIYLSVIAIIIFALSNWILPFINKNIISEKSTFKNLLFGSVAGIVFIGIELFRYGVEYFPGVETGLAFMFLAIIYFILSFLMIKKIGIDVIKSEKSIDGANKNTVLLYLGISISLFSFAIALVFSNVKEVVSMVWLFEATILFYFFSKIKEKKIYVAGLVLFAIGVLNLFTLLDVVKAKDFWFLVPFTIIFVFFVFNLKFLDKFYSKKYYKIISHDIFHIIGISVLGLLLKTIIPNTHHGWSILGISIFLTVLSWTYSFFNSGLLRRFFEFSLIAFFLIHIFNSEHIISLIDSSEKGYLRILQYISTVILGFSVYIWNYFNKEKVLNITINISYSIYLLIITSIYVFDIFSSTFFVTIYWGLLSAIFIFYGLQKNILKYRTLGLYLLSLTAGKIFLLDIWSGFDNAIARVAALLIIGILFIIISIAYSRKLGNNLKGEFSFSNFYGESYNKVKKR